MSTKPVISVENLSKSYRLGQISTGTLSYDLALWWAKMRTKSNPRLRIGEIDHGNRDGELLWAIKDISFQMQQGEVLGIIGRNGAGKSTLLKILARVTAPTSGRVKVKGRIASLLEVGTGFHPDLTGRENIYLNGAILGMNKAEVRRKFDEIVAFAEVQDFVDTPVKRYSSGMYVRLAFAVAAHLEPEILLVDEVLAVGDGAFQKKCLGKMEEVASEGRTILFVSHNMAAVRTICQKCLVIRQGNVDFLGDVASGIHHYQSLQTEDPTKNTTYRPAVAFHQVTVGDSGTSSLNSGEAFAARCNVKIREPVNGFHLYCILLNGDGEAVVHAHSDHHELPQLMQPGDYELEVNFPGLWLKPGVYSVHFKLIPNMLAKGHIRFLSDSVMLDVNSDASPEMLLGELTPDVRWFLQ